MPLEPEQARKLWIALGISLGFHFAVALVGEISSHDAPKTLSQAPVVEISRVAMDGSSLPSGKGDASFNSVGSVYDPGSNPNLKNFNSVEAGVPMRLKEPPATSQAPPSQTPQSQVPPIQGAPVNQPSSQPSGQATYNPPQQQDSPQTNPQTTANSGQNASAPSTPSTAGNQGQQRKRGPNRAAFPIETVEPNVPASMVGGSVTNSVEVSVDIAVDGSHAEKIVRSSGSADVDALVLDALKNWKWDPAAREGNPVASNQSFKFTFKPR